MRTDRSSSRRWIGDRRKWLSGIVALISAIILAIAGLWWANRSAQPPLAESAEHDEPHEAGVIILNPQAQANIGLKLAESERRTVTTYIETTGTVAPNETRVAHIRPLARGLIEKVHVKLGDVVRAGQPLVSYDNIELGELIGDYLSERARLEEARAQLEVARTFLERAERLIEVEAIARKDYELRQAQYRTALATVRRQEADIAKIEEKLHRFGLTDADIERLQTGREHQFHRTASHNVLRAPFDGVIIAYDVAEGEVVGPDRELFTLVDTSTVWVLADVYEKDLAAVRVGQPVEIRVPAYPRETFTGTITYISDMIEPETRTARVRCVVSNPDRKLKLEMFATIRIPRPEGRQAILIPSQAIQEIDGRPIAFVKVGADRFERRELTLGEQTDQWVEVRSGIQPGELVVTEGSFYLKSILKREEIGGEH